MSIMRLQDQNLQVHLQQAPATPFSVMNRPSDVF